jgi:hypothetical protein
MEITNRQAFLRICRASSISVLAAEALVDWLGTFDYRNAKDAEIGLEQDRFSFWGIDDDIEDFLAVLSLDRKYRWNDPDVLKLRTIADVLLFCTRRAPAAGHAKRRPSARQARA